MEEKDSSHTFNQKSFNVEEFKSCWQTERTSENVEVQTIDCPTAECESQVVTTNTAEVQTNIELIEEKALSEIDYEKLAVFLNRVCPSILTELDKIEKSRAFNRQEILRGDFEGGSKTLMHSLQPTQENSVLQKMVSSISWSCSGSLLAFGFGLAEHDNWCDHSGQVVFFNINRQEFSFHVPTKSMETNSCVSQISFHPVDTAIIAVGMFSGEVAIWNLQKDIDFLIGTSANIHGGHKDTVTQISWIPNPNPTQQWFPLVTAGKDGQILLWHFSTLSGKFRLNEGFAISLDYGHHHNKIQTPLGGGLDNEIGVTCFSFNFQERSTFIAGVEGGGLLKCSLVANKPASVRSEIPLKDPVLSSYEGHLGTVTCVQCSLIQWETFLTCGIDQEIHIYQLSQTSPKRVIYTELVYIGVAWCPTNSQLFCAWGESGSVEFFSLNKGEIIPSLQLISEKHPPNTALKFNPHSPQILAIGDVKGAVAVWQISALDTYNDHNQLTTNK